MKEPPPGTYQVCPVCYWEDDYIQSVNLTVAGPPNGISLGEAQRNFLQYSAVLQHLKLYVRPPSPEEIP